MVPTQGHEHGVDVPVLVGPLVLETLLTLGLVTAGVAVALRPFLAGRDRSLVAKAATLGAAAAGVSLLLTKGPADGMPTGLLAALAIAGIGLPFVAVRGDRPRLAAALRPVAPIVVVLAAFSALAATATGAAFAVAVGLPWSVLSGWTRRSRPHRNEGDELHRGRNEEWIPRPAPLTRLAPAKEDES